MKKFCITVLSLLIVFTHAQFAALAEELIEELSVEEPIIEPEPEPGPEPQPSVSESIPVIPSDEAPVESTPDYIPKSTDPIFEPPESEQESESQLEPTFEELPEEVPEAESQPEPGPIQPQVLINEVLADPREKDAENEFIEIYNVGAEAVDLTGWRLDDAKEDDGAYLFDNVELDYVLEPDSFIVLYRLETDITLNNDVDAVHLYDATGNEIDSFELISVLSGYSWGRNPENSDEWMMFKTPTPGETNIVEANVAPVAVIDVQRDTGLMKLNVTGENSYDPDGNAVSFLWEFEEGVYDERMNPLLYEYLTPGEKLVRLTVTDFFGDIGETEIIFVATTDSGGGEPKPESESEPKPESEPEPDSVPSELPLVYLNEILADPEESDAENEFIEIYNAGTESVDLIGWKLDDAREDDGAYEFLNTEIDYFLEPGGYLVLFRPETGITLNNDVEEVALFDANGIQIDFFDFNSQSSGVSWGRSPEDAQTWLTFKTPTPGSENIIEPNGLPVAVVDVQKDTKYMKLNVTGANSYDPDGDKLNYLWEFEPGIFDDRENPLIYEYSEPGEYLVRLTVTDIYGDIGIAEISFIAETKNSKSIEELEVFPIYSLINEVMPAPEGKDTEGEWVELFNDNSFGIDLSNWYLDDAEGKSTPYRIPEDTIILPGSYLVFSEPGLGLSFKNSEDVVRLLDPNKNVNQEVLYFGAQENWSYARQSYNTYEWTSLFTPGGPNDFPPPPKAYTAGSVVFESVLPNPEGTDSGNEQVSLVNKTDEDINLMGWTMSDASGTERAMPNVVLPVHESVILMSSEFKLSLNNSDESLSLFDPVGNLIDEIKWKSSASGQWLFNPDSLQNGMEAEVVRVVDGDTFVIQFDEKKLTVRLIGVDTPETVHPFKPVEYYGKQASNYLTERLSGQWVTLEFDENKIDKYGRVLAYVYLGDEMINESILSEGYGFAYTRFSFKYFDEFVALEALAREAGLGLWQDATLSEMVDEFVEKELELEDELEEEMLLEEEMVMEETGLQLMPDCKSDFLKIDSFLPNPQKGEMVEYIKLINTGSELVCLYGWQLDDVVEKGSKPFAIKGGSIAPGGVRVFRKQETGLALNNKDDCVNLIEPGGLVADQICYDKTHKNEIFTHTGGDWVPKLKVKKTSKKKSSKTLRHRFKREFVSYQSDLPVTTYVGRISAIDEEAQVMIMELETGRQISISYASSPVNMSITKEIIDFTEPIAIKTYESKGMHDFISIRTVNSFGQLSEEASGIPVWLWSFFLILPAILGRFAPWQAGKKRFGFVSNCIKN